MLTSAQMLSWRPWPAYRANTSWALGRGKLSSDAVFVNAGATHPREVWLDSLREGGRLLLPIAAVIDASGSGIGGMFLITRRPAGFAATHVSPVAIYSCLGWRDSTLNQEISRKRGSESSVQSLRRDGHDRDDTCWLHTPGTCLSTLTLVTGRGN